MTATANSAFTAAQFNTHVRDNLLETGPAKATTAGRLLVTTGANSLAERVITQAVNVNSQTTTSTSFTDLATVGPRVTVTTGTRALVWFSAQMSNSQVNTICAAAVAVTGATSLSADNTKDLYIDGLPSGQALRSTTVELFDTLTPGSNTFTLQYRVGGGTGTFYDRAIGVIAL
jgi:hypothetical protein